MYNVYKSEALVHRGNKMLFVPVAPRTITTCPIPITLPDVPDTPPRGPARRSWPWSTSTTSPRWEIWGENRWTWRREGRCLMSHVYCQGAWTPQSWRLHQCGETSAPLPLLLQDEPLQVWSVIHLNTDTPPITASFTRKTNGAAGSLRSEDNPTPSYSYSYTNINCGQDPPGATRGCPRAK